MVVAAKGYAPIMKHFSNYRTAEQRFRKTVQVEEWAQRKTLSSMTGEGKYQAICWHSASFARSLLMLFIWAYKGKATSQWLDNYTFHEGECSSQQLPNNKSHKQPTYISKSGWVQIAGIQHKWTGKNLRSAKQLMFRWCSWCRDLLIIKMVMSHLSFNSSLICQPWLVRYSQR